MNRYEYRTMRMAIERLGDESFVHTLNQLGADGWNLVSTVSHERHGYSREVHLIFSRVAEVGAHRGVELEVAPGLE